jgi:hypothetical protein
MFRNNHGLAELSLLGLYFYFLLLERNMLALVCLSGEMAEFLLDLVCVHVFLDTLDVLQNTWIIVGQLASIVLAPFSNQCIAFACIELYS